MIHGKFFVAAAAVTLLCLSGAENGLQAQQRQQKDSTENRFSAKRKSPKKAELIKENETLKIEIDSLHAELARMAEEMRINDSINSELLDIYDENEDKSAAGLNPEDYNTEVTDSLLSIWYMQQKISEDDYGQYDMDSVRFESNVPDEVYISRIKAMNSLIDLPYNDIVKNYIIL